MGKAKLTSVLGLSREDGEALFQAYHGACPFAGETMQTAIDEATRTRCVRTLLGRISRFELYGPVDYVEDAVPLPFSAAVAKYGDVKLAMTHKALNRKLQGSAADLMKMAMLKLWQSGILAEIGVPRLTVHDELDFSDPGASPKLWREVRDIMQNAIPLRVPVLVDCEIGPNWGNVQLDPEMATKS